MWQLMSFTFFVSVVVFPVRSRNVFFSCHRIISHDRNYIEQNLPASHFLVRPSIASSTYFALLSGEYRCWSFLDYVEDIYLAGRLLRSSQKKLLPFVPLFTICIISPKTVYAIYCIYLIATL